MRYSVGVFSLSLLLSATVQAEPLLLQNKDNALSLSIYNQNLSLVKDMRKADLKGGVNEIIFDGVAQRIQPETAIIYGDGIKVAEQNYSYNLMNYANFINQSIGENVTTVRINPENGENIFEKAQIIGANSGQPILRFDYGIETNYPGRVIFDKIPAGMSNKPTLAAKLNVAQGGLKNLQLAYLTDGISWKTDYVANVIDNTKLDLTGWVTINNESGVDYEKAKIQLVAGAVNIVRPMMARSRGMMMKTIGFAANDAMEMGAPEPEIISSYELYTLPNITTIKDKQTKQIALIERKNVTYKKEFNLQSPFYFGDYGDNEFEKHHPYITYVMENVAASNLGISLPGGTMRFYENDKNGNLQFIGSDMIKNTSKEDTIRLDLGEAFNISLSGKIKQIRQDEISRKPENKCFMVKTLRTYEVEVTLNNAEDVDNTVIFKQSVPAQHKIVKENIKSELKNAIIRQWAISAAKNSKSTLNYTVEVTFDNRVCH